MHELGLREILTSIFTIFFNVLLRKYININISMSPIENQQLYQLHPFLNLCTEQTASKQLLLLLLPTQSSGQCFHLAIYRSRLVELMPPLQLMTCVGSLKAKDAELIKPQAEASGATQVCLN